MEPQKTASAPLLSAPLMGPIALWRYAWGKYRENWKPLTTIILLPYAATYIGLGLMAIERLPFTILGGLVMFAGIVFTIAAYVGLMDASVKLGSDMPLPHLKDQYRIGFKLFWGFVLLGIIQYAVMAGSLALFVIPAAIVAIYTSFAFVAYVADGKKAFSAFTESFAAVRGRWWKTLGRILFLVLVHIAIMLIIVGIRFLVTLIFGYKLGSGPDVIVGTLLQVFVALALIPVVILYVTKLYQSLKETRVDLPTKSFKNWLVAFVVIGVLAIISLPIVMGTVIKAQLDAKARQALAEQDK